MMKIPDPVAPYVSLIKWALIAALLVGLRVEGCVAGKRSNQAEIVTKDARIKSLETSLTEFIGLYDRTTAQTEANAKAAKKIQDEGVALVIRSANERKAAIKKAEKLEAQLQAERAGCSDGEKPICGVPLR